MATYALRQIDPEIIAKAKQRARAAGTSLDDVLRGYLVTYAAGDRGVAGGRARAASLTPGERADSARRAAKARWHQP